MEHFIRCFSRDGYGAWTCVEPAELTLPSGRIQILPGAQFRRGNPFMGVDVAKLLDEHYALTRAPSRS